MLGARATVGWILAALLVSSLTSPRVKAQDVALLRPPPDAHGFLRLPGTRMPGPAQLTSSLWLGYRFRTGWLDGESSRVPAIEHRLESDVSAQVGVGRRLAFGIDLPVAIFANDGRGGALLDSPLSRAGLGDPRFFGRILALGDLPRSDDDRAEGLALAFLLAATAPLGHVDGLRAEPGPTLELLSSLDFHVFGAGIGAMLGYRHRFEHAVVGDVRLREEILYGLGFKVPMPTDRDLALLLELRGAIDARTPFRAMAQTPVVLDVGARMQVGSFVVTTTIGAGLNRAFASPAMMATLGVTWASPPWDVDGDGIRVGRDRCPDMPEDFDGFEDDDGCPDLDDDEDGIPDADDRCPRDYASEDDDLDEDGCIDVDAQIRGEEPLTRNVRLTRLEVSSGFAPTVSFDGSTRRPVPSCSRSVVGAFRGVGRRMCAPVGARARPLPARPIPAEQS